MYDLISSWHIGKGSKYDKKGNYDLAIKHYYLALEYHRKTAPKERPTGIEEMLAWSYAKLNDFVKAKIYAENALAIYLRYQDENKPKDFFSESANRMKKLLKDIENIKS